MYDINSFLTINKDKSIMKIVVAATNKGGDGKTKLSILLAEYFALVQKKRVLAIDFDPQCNFSHRFLPMEIDPVDPQGKIPPLHTDFDPSETHQGWDGRSSIANIFYGEPVVPYSTHFDTLDIAPGHAARLLEAEAVRKTEVKEKVHQQLKLFLHDPELQKYYDVILIDTAPSKGPLTVSAIKAATHVVIPAQMEQNSIQGIYGMLQLWKQESLCRPSSQPIELVGILPNKLREVNLHKDLLGELKETRFIGDFVLPCSLRLRSIYAEVDEENASPKTIFQLPPKHIARIEAETVCNEIYQRVYKND